MTSATGKIAMKNLRFCICDTEKKLILRNPESGLWHPFIEKAKIYRSVAEAQNDLALIGAGGENGLRTPYSAVYEGRYEIGCVQAMQCRTFEDACKKLEWGAWMRPFHASTGIRNSIPMRKVA